MEPADFTEITLRHVSVQISTKSSQRCGEGDKVRGGKRKSPGIGTNVKIQTTLERRSAGRRLYSFRRLLRISRGSTEHKQALRVRPNWCSANRSAEISINRMIWNPESNPHCRRRIDRKTKLPATVMLYMNPFSLPTWLLRRKALLY